VSTPERSFEQLNADYARYRAAAMESAQRMQAVAATVTSTNGLVTITVGPQGEIRSLSFNSKDYRKMAPAELAHVVLDTFDKARESALQQAAAALPSFSFGGLNSRDLLNGRVDWEQVLPEKLDVDGFVLPGQ
jgi:DNA-binding protein YbaB